MQRLQCTEIWGGVRNVESDLCSACVTVSLYSSSADGGKGGDVYYFSVCGLDKLTRLVLADVVGHGEQVSTVGEWIYDGLNEHMNDLDQQEILAHLNTRAEKAGFHTLSTAAAVSYYSANGNLYYSYAGHPPIFALRRGQDDWQTLELPPAEAAMANLPLGVSSDTRYDLACVPAQAGDQVVIYSDGVIEGPDSQRRLFGAEGLRAALQETRGDGPMQVRRAVLDRLRAHTGGSLRHDDVTIIALQVHG